MTMSEKSVNIKVVLVPFLTAFVFLPALQCTIRLRAIDETQNVLQRLDRKYGCLLAGEGR